MSRSRSSLSYSLRKIAEKIASYSPSSATTAVLVMMASIFLLGGGVYNIFMYDELPAIFPLGGGRFLSYVPYQIHEQLLSGSIGVMILYGLYLLLLSILKKLERGLYWTILNPL